MNFRILIPTSNDYARTVLPITLRCLRNSGLRNPVDVIHYEVAPPEECRAEPWMQFHDHGTQRGWSRAIGEFLDGSHDLTLLMLDDYGICGPVDEGKIKAVLEEFDRNKFLAVCHLTWQHTGRGCAPVTDRVEYLNHDPQWPYACSTQAAIWRTYVLASLADTFSHHNIDDFEIQASRWMQKTSWRHAQANMKPPTNALTEPMADELDNKLDWVVPYHNLWHRGKPDPRHETWISSLHFSN